MTPEEQEFADFMTEASIKAMELRKNMIIFQKSTN